MLNLKMNPFPFSKIIKAYLISWQFSLLDGFNFQVIQEYLQAYQSLSLIYDWK